VGCIDRKRVLTLFTLFHDNCEDHKVKETLMNPRKWPVVEFEEEEDEVKLFNIEARNSSLRDDEDDGKISKNTVASEVMVSEHKESEKEISNNQVEVEADIDVKKEDESEAVDTDNESKYMSDCVISPQPATPDQPDVALTTSQLNPMNAMIDVMKISYITPTGDEDKQSISTGKIESYLESYASDSGSRDTRLNSLAAKQLSYIDDNGLPHFKSSSVAIDKDVQKIMKKKSSSSVEPEAILGVSRPFSVTTPNAF